MAWIAVRTDRGEELASYEITDEEGWADQERVAPGLGNAISHALHIEERQRAERAAYEARPRGG